MSDSKEHTMQGGVDWELRTAEDAMVAAPGGSKELALAMRRHADGVRNMMQSELVPSFEHAIDRMMERRVVDVLASVQQSLDVQMGLVEQVLATAREALTVSRAGQRGWGKLNKDVTQLKRAMSDSKDDREQLHHEVADVRADVAVLHARLDRQEDFERRLRLIEERTGNAR